MSKESYKKNREILYKMHDRELTDKTVDTHHIIFKSDHGTNELENLSLLDKEFHQWIHHLIDLLERNK